MTNELAKRYAHMNSSAEQLCKLHEPKCARIEAAKAQARAAQFQSASSAASGATGAASCLALIVAGLFALAAIFG